MTKIHAPLKKKTVRAKARAPWYNTDIENANTCIIEQKVERRSGKNHGMITHLMNQSTSVLYQLFQ